LPYLPLLNPLDIMQILALLTVTAWWRALPAVHTSPLSKPQGYAALAAWTFIFLNAVLLRSLHHWAGVPHTFAAHLESNLTQASLSIFWTLLGLAVMVVAASRRWREVWIVAAVLLGVVVAKLFMVDLAGRDTIEAIISFIAVGVLLLVVGYFSPLPPKARMSAGAAQ
jgi:uncharacterized membrane protein